MTTSKKQTIEESQAYFEKFQATLKEFGVKNIKELSDANKKKFFDKLDVEHASKEEKNESIVPFNREDQKQYAKEALKRLQNSNPHFDEFVGNEDPNDNGTPNAYRAGAAFHEIKRLGWDVGDDTAGYDKYDSSHYITARKEHPTDPEDHVTAIIRIANHPNTSKLGYDRPDINIAPGEDQIDDIEDKLNAKLKNVNEGALDMVPILGNRRNYKSALKELKNFSSEDPSVIATKAAEIAKKYVNVDGKKLAKMCNEKFDASVLDDKKLSPEQSKRADIIVKVMRKNLTNMQKKCDV